jgi:uncharacterized integral membrane protein
MRSKQLTQSERNAEDTKVLLVGAVCTILIFMVFTVYEGASVQTITYIETMKEFP